MLSELYRTWYRLQGLMPPYWRAVLWQRPSLSSTAVVLCCLVPVEPVGLRVHPRRQLYSTISMNFLIPKDTNYKLEA
jgi:hypothetical protein